MSQNKIALVTGSNRGIGLELVKNFCQLGFTTIMTSRDLDEGKCALESLEQNGFKPILKYLDVTNLDSIKLLRAFIEKDFGRLDILVNNAGIYLDEGKNLTEIDPDIFSMTVQTNLEGPFFLLNQFLPMMKKNNYGRIINISSGYGQLSSMTAQVGSYKISKLALNGLTQIMASELKNYNIKINSVCPGWVHTRMGGENAPRSPDQAAKGMLWLALLADSGPSGKFFRDRDELDW